MSMYSVKTTSICCQISNDQFDLHGGNSLKWQVTSQNLEKLRKSDQPLKHALINVSQIGIILIDQSVDMYVDIRDQCT